MHANPAEHAPAAQGSAHTKLPVPKATQLLDRHSTSPPQGAPSCFGASLANEGEPAVEAVVTVALLSKLH